MDLPKTVEKHEKQLQQLEGLNACSARSVPSATTPRSVTNKSPRRSSPSRSCRPLMLHVCRGL